MKKSRVHVGLRIPMDLNDDLTEIAEQQEISKNLLMLKILRRWVEVKKENVYRH